MLLNLSLQTRYFYMNNDVALIRVYYTKRMAKKQKQKSKLPIQLAGLLLFNGQGHVAIVRQTNGIYSLPKGHIDRLPDKTFEAAHEAAIRETCEELSVNPDEIELLGKLGVVMFKTRKKRKKQSAEGNAAPRKVVHLFEAKVKDNVEIKPNLQDTHEAMWASPEDVLRLLPPQFVAYLREHSDQFAFLCAEKEGVNEVKIAPQIPYPAEGMSRYRTR